MENNIKQQKTTENNENKNPFDTYCYSEHRSKVAYHILSQTERNRDRRAGRKIRIENIAEDWMVLKIPQLRRSAGW